MPNLVNLLDLAAYGLDAERWEWQLQGSCRGADSAVFFHPDGERGRARAVREYTAKRICRGCPVVAQCREYALTVREPYGIWGGLSENERRLLENRWRHAPSSDRACHRRR